MLTCSNLPTKPQATLFLFNKKPGMCQSCCFKVGCHPLFYNRIHVKPLKLCNKSRRSNRQILQKINKFASLVLAEWYPYFTGVIGLHIWRDLIYSEMSVCCWSCQHLQVIVQSGCIRQQSRSSFWQPKSAESVEDEKKSVLMQLINSLQNEMVV